MSEKRKLEGSMVALVTPLAGGEVDYDALGRLIELQIDGGTQGLVPCGTTGESPTLSHAEHDRVIEFTVERAAGRVPVIAGTGSNSTAEALRLTRHARSAGADACLIVTPYYNKPTQHGMYEHVAKLAEAGLPIVLYNIPSRTGVELTPETVIRMYNEIEMVVGIKEATG
ncbi:MAG TPA: 4-hydroxy-tetrahydrodipicolinate synthase, partial [Phycisphaerae bacterium]|nr:4-hydroxy-tetrahydrodipicolinate synthase [Phycisphaerae bacterium]